jgi:hypothetical protein
VTCRNLHDTFAVDAGMRQVRPWERAGQRGGDGIAYRLVPISMQVRHAMLIHSMHANTFLARSMPT